jgi:hypothetical protein
MSFSVMWSRAAEYDLAASVQGVSDRESLIAVAQQLEQALAKDPMNVGESGGGPSGRVAFSYVAYRLSFE